MVTAVKASTIGLVAAVATATALAGPALARMHIWDLEIGSTVDELPPATEFKGYACGSNGGPPLKPITGWADFAECAPDAAGLHEVYFEYDDEDEFIARAYEDIRLGRDVGTVDKSFPIITSALFDDQGVLSGLRLVTDARQEKQIFNEWAGLRERQDHHLLAAYLYGQLGIEIERDCETLPLAEGEGEIAGSYVKRHCERVDEATGRRYIVDQRYFRKEGQAGRDPHTGALTQGQYESIARIEIYRAGAGPSSADAP